MMMMLVIVMVEVGLVSMGLMEDGVVAGKVRVVGTLFVVVVIGWMIWIWFVYTMSTYTVLYAW